MCFSQWSLLPLLVLLWLPLPETIMPTHAFQSQSNDKAQAHVESLLAFKKSVGDPSILRSWMRKEPCRNAWIGVHCVGTLQNSTIVSLKLSGFKLNGSISPALQNLTTLRALWLNNNSLRGYIPPGLGNLKHLTSLRLADNHLSGTVPPSLTFLPKLEELSLTNNHLRGSFPFRESHARVMNILVAGNDELCSHVGSFNLSKCKSTTVPTLTFTPPRFLNDNDSGKSKTQIAAILGGVAGALVLVGITIACVCYFLIRAKSFSSSNSETRSSEPSMQGMQEPPSTGEGILLSEVQGARIFPFLELEHATKSFSQSNLIGQGRFGLVYKGLLYDGTVVAIKRRTANPSQDFANEVQILSRIRHRHLVSLLGYCQENGQQLLVYDYLPNGSVSNFLYDSMGNSLGKLDFKQRLSIAVGTAKGLQHLHNLRPPVVHKNFKTSNVLVDEDFIAKVTDFGLYGLLAGPHEAGTSSHVNGFLDPEFNESRILNQKSDVYSFGVFLLELVSGREAISLNRPQPEQHLVKLVQSLKEANMVDNLIDSSLNQSFSVDGMKDFLALALRCVESVGVKRPTMTEVVEELEQIIDKERGLTASMVEGTIVTLGSELFG